MMVMTARKYFARHAASVDASIESTFYGSLKMRNNTFKLTSASRFSEIEAALGPLLKQHASAIRQSLDIGVSTGITTVELADFLRHLGATSHLTATDLFVHGAIVKPCPGMHVFADATGWPLQYEVLGVPVRPWIRRLDYLTLMAFPRMALLKAMHARTRELVARGKAQPVRMISRSLEARSDISFIENNILEPAPELAGKFDFIRAANVLNSNYFAEPELRKAVANLKSYLRGPGSLALITRTNKEHVNAGTLFQSGKGGGLKVIARVGSGSEIEQLVTQNAD